MLSAIERRLGFLQSTPERAAARAEVAARKRAEAMRILIDDRVGAAVSRLERDLSSRGISTYESLARSEEEFQETLAGIEEKVADRYSATKPERAFNSRSVAVRAMRSIRFELDYPNPAKPETVPSFKRCMRSVAAWGLQRTEGLTEQPIDNDWAVEFLGKVLKNSFTDADLHIYQNNPPAHEGSGRRAR